MNILICTETLTAGGAEIFLMNWASFANQNGVNTSILCFHSRLDKKKSIEKHLSDTVVYYPYRNKKWDLFIARLDRLISKAGVKFSFRDRRLKNRIHSILKKENIKIVHSHLFPADLFLATCDLPTHVKHFTTIHGDYLRHFYKEKEQRKIKNFDQKLDLVKASLDGLIVISDKQLGFFKNEINWSGKIEKIYNGFNLEHKTSTVKSGTFVIGMVSRGIKEKGWKEACEAFLRAGINKSELRLIGESEYLNELQKDYQDYPNIHFLGYHPNPSEEIVNFDMALLPSYYGSESLPTVLIEYFNAGIPSITSNMGEIENMIKSDNGNSAFILESSGNPIDPEKLSEALLKLYHNPELRASMALNAKLCAKKFDIANCVNSYLSFYEK